MNYFENIVYLSSDLLKAFKETITMVSISFIFVLLIGVPLGVILSITKNKDYFKNTYVNKILSTITDIIRATPTIILISTIAPFTKIIIGTKIGVKGAIVPLVVAGCVFLARQIEAVIENVDKGVIEAAKSMGISSFGIIARVVLPESIIGIISAATISLVSLINFSTIAGAVGGGGLGNFALTYGYQQFKGDVMLVTVFILISMVMLVQHFSRFLVKRFDKS